MEKIRRNKKAIAFFLIPGMILYTVLLMAPIAGSLVISFFKWNGIKGVPMIFVGFDNFKHVISDTAFWHSVKNIMWFMILTLLTQLPVGLLLAVMLSERYRGYRIFKFAYFVPQVLSTTVIGLLWYFILMPTGVLNTVLRSVGLDSLVRSWLVDRNTAMTTIILVNTWCGIGFHMTVSYAAISGIPEDIIEAGKLEGASGLKKIRYIIIPMIWESIISSIVVIITAVLKTFDLVYVMTEGGPNGLTDVPSTLLYKEAFRYNDFGKASVIGVYIFLLSIVFTVISLRITKRERLEY
ncbi:MAG: sugar ABC transporter permease [Lachnospiraceae bacterium]|jgi:raffinose/stachyose/melibiose transport system permease protein|nr:sugar ABC transporter permease [Lachnospiraceae bacterium]